MTGRMTTTIVGTNTYNVTAKRWKHGWELQRLHRDTHRQGRQRRQSRHHTRPRRTRPQGDDRPRTTRRSGPAAAGSTELISCPRSRSAGGRAVRVGYRRDPGRVPRTRIPAQQSVIAASYADRTGPRRTRHVSGGWPRASSLTDEYAGARLPVAANDGLVRGDDQPASVTAAPRSCSASECGSASGRSSICAAWYQLTLRRLMLLIIHDRRTPTPPNLLLLVRGAGRRPCRKR